MLNKLCPICGDPLTYHLTPAQIAVVELAARGFSNEEIAVELTIEPGTVKMHLQDSFARLHARNRQEVVLAAQQLGIIPLPTRGKGPPTR